MPIPKKRVPIQLEKQEPTQLTVESLKEQFDNMGLTCAHTDPARLEKYKNEVQERFFPGQNQSFAINRPTPSLDGRPFYNSIYGDSDAPFLGYEEASKSDWKPEGSGLGYSTQLSTVAFPRNFQFLMVNRPSFNGNQSEEKTTKGKYATVDAVKNMFVQVGVEASASLVKGLDKTTLNSILSNAIAPLNEKNVKDYYNADSRVVFLVDNYDPETNQADAIGVLGIDWRLTIVDYKEKKKSPTHDTTLIVSTRSVLYDDLNALDGDLQFIKSHFGADLFGGIPPRSKKLKIFEKLPPANQDTFDQSLPVIAKDDFVDVIVLYAPDLQSVGAIDNSDSDIQTTYSKTIASGFTFSMSEKISVGAEFEAGVVFAKGKFSVGLEVSFTEQWNESQSETISFSAPGRKKAFTYQSYLLSRHLRFNPSDGSFKYSGSEGRFLTNVLKTTEAPITGLSTITRS
jgi:hypothetical protein